MNRRNREFAEEVSDLLCVIRDSAIIEAQKKHISPYDVELVIDDCLTIHMTYRMIATKDCAMRHFENLSTRKLFLYDRKDGYETIKLNPKYADAEVDLLIHRVKMPENKPM